MPDPTQSLDGAQGPATAHFRGWISVVNCQHVFLTLLVLSFASFGCEAKRPEAKTQTTTADLGSQPQNNGHDQEAQRIWQQTLTAYRTANHYQDDATITLSYMDGGRRFEDQTSISVRWSRPNRLVVKAYQVQLVCDGQQLRAIVNDRGTGNLDGQVLTRAAPPTLSTDDLLSDPLLADQLRNSLLESESGRLPPQLELLLEHGDHDLLVARKTSLHLLERKSLAGRECHRLKWQSSRGSYLFWIDVNSFLIRRIEFPREALIQPMAQSKELTSVQLVVDMTNVTINSELPDATFIWPPTSTAPSPASTAQTPRSVEYFVSPPLPLPTRLYGQKPTNFRLTPITRPANTTDTAITNESLRGNIAILLWFRNHPSCENALQQLHSIYQDMRDATDIAVWAVSTEPTTQSDSQVLSQVRRWGVDLPVARDRQAHGRDCLSIEGAPTLVILDGHSHLQFFETGMNPNWGRELPRLIERLRRGDDLAGEITRQHQRELDEYHKQLNAAAHDSQDTQDTLPAVEPSVTLAAAAPATKLPLIHAWTHQADHITGPIWMTTEGSSPSIEYLEGGRALVTLNLQGEVTRRQDLPLPAGFTADLIATQIDEHSQRHYVLANSQQQQVHWLNHRYELVTSFPQSPPSSSTSKPVVIRDLQLLTQTNQPSLTCAVVWSSVTGVELVDPQGQSLWRNRRLAPTLSVTAAQIHAPAKDLGSGQQRGDIWVCGEQGALMSISSSGRSFVPRELSGWRVRQLAASQASKQASRSNEQTRSMAALAINRRGDTALVAFDQEAREQWSYPLPTGTLPHRYRRLVSGSFFTSDGDDWAVNAADGTIHVISGDGATFDYLASGQSVRGVAIGNIAGKGWLLATSREGVHAWHYLPPTTKNSSNESKTKAD